MIFYYLYTSQPENSQNKQQICLRQTFALECMQISQCDGGGLFVWSHVENGGLGGRD